MKLIRIIFEIDSLEIERSRDMCGMSEDDVRWCFLATIILADESRNLSIEVPLFNFSKQLLEIVSITSEEPKEFLDFYDAYRLRVSCEKGLLRVSEEYGGGEVMVSATELLSNYVDEFRAAVGLLQETLPTLKSCKSFQEVTNKTGEELEKGSVRKRVSPIF